MKDENLKLFQLSYFKVIRFPQFILTSNDFTIYAYVFKAGYTTRITILTKYNVLETMKR